MPSGSKPSEKDPVLTDGYGCYIRIRRGVYHMVDRRGRRTGRTCSGFQPRPRWKPARRCAFDIPKDGLTCPNCGDYDTGYAMTGERSYCRNQGKGWTSEVRSLGSVPVRPGRQGEGQ